MTDMIGYDWIMIEYKDRTCVNCKYRVYDSSIPPCKDCDLHDNWEPRQ